ncbi:MAG TPA: class I SAM-dependent methyltransferase [Candidatus Peribacterales bacterium]|nr:class I SAM-dependent methyltransferase [Candidatus Peribacterales bacterium]
MLPVDEIYIHCDKLDLLPALNRENWLWESEWLCANFKPNSTVLQVGSCEGSRIVDLMKGRTDLRITGIEIDPILHHMALTHFINTGTNAQSVLGDMTNPGDTKNLGHFDYCICLNNTLGYIENQDAVIRNMKSIATSSIISVYGEKFTDDIAREYFAAIKLNVTRIEGDIIHIKDFGIVRRYRESDVAKWNGEMTKTPLGYLCVIQ